MKKIILSLITVVLLIVPLQGTEIFDKENIENKKQYLTPYEEESWTVMQLFAGKGINKKNEVIFDSKTKVSKIDDISDTSDIDESGDLIDFFIYYSLGLCCGILK